MSPVALLDSLGASLGDPKAPLSSNLVPLSLQVHINLPLLASTCALSGQLRFKMCPNLPSNANFHRICDPSTLDFCNTLHCFRWFCNIRANLVKTAFQASEMTPKCSPEPPKMPPRAAKRRQERFKSAQELFKSASRAPKSAPRSLR